MLTSITIPQAQPTLAGVYQPYISSGPLGAVIFVNSASGADSRGRLKFFGGPASSPSKGTVQGPVGDASYPLATVFGTNGALSFCSANRGDIIVVAAGHTENLSTNGTYTVPAGVNILGVGYGNARPKFTHTGGTATTIIGGTGGGMMFSNVIFDLTGVASVANGFTFAVSGVQFVNCRIIQSGATNKATTAILLNAGADDFTFYGCDLDAVGAAGAVTNGIITGATVNRAEILNNLFHGNYTAGQIVAANGNPMLDMTIQNNEFRNTTVSAAQAVMTLGNASSGVISNNNFFVGGTTTGVGSSVVGTPTSTLIVWNQNFGYNNVANKGGNLIPVAGAALT